MKFSNLSLSTFLAAGAMGQAATITPLVDEVEIPKGPRSLGGSSKLKSGIPSSQLHKVKKLGNGPTASQSHEVKKLSSGTLTPQSYEVKKLVNDQKAIHNPRPRVIGGENADHGEYEYYTQLLYSDNNSICGGSLIAPNVVLTAAHCYLNTLDMVSVGAYSITMHGGYEEGYSEHAGITDIAIHPDYIGDENQYDMDNDVMVLKLDESLTLDLVTLNDDSSLPRTGDRLTVIGLGRTSAVYESSLAYTLQELELQVVDTDECFPYGDIRNDVVNDATEFCAGKVEGQSSCQGDSGGPIFEIDPATGEHIQMGVVSYGGATCAEEGESSVYSRVDANLGWIRQQVCDEWGVDAPFCVGGSGPGPSPPSSDDGPSPSPPSSDDGSSDDKPSSPATEGDCGPSETYMLFEIGVDAWGGEVSWDFRYSSGALIQSDSGFNDGEIRTYDGCLSESASSCYYLTIYDSYCDGMSEPYGGMNPYIYVVWGLESYLDMPSYTCDISFELCH